MREEAPGMHRLEFQIFGLFTKGEIELHNTFHIPFFYAPE
jgi:hypothetical protein